MSSIDPFDGIDPFDPIYDDNPHLCAAHREMARLRDQITSIRNETIEECIKEIDSCRNEMWNIVCDTFVEKLRALKGKT